jgi:modulator of FtsH protease
MNNNIRYFSQRYDYANPIIINRVLINTYLLLFSTILFSAFMTFISIRSHVSQIGFLPMLIIYFSLLFLINIFKKSFISLVLVFVLTGFLGYYIGPFINHFLYIKNGTQILFMSLSLTSFVFLSLSIYSFLTRKNFSFLRNFLFVGTIVIISCVIFNLFFSIKLLHLVISALIIIFSSALILYEISSIINEGNTDYIDVTVSLYLSIYNIFINLLSIFGILSNND